VHWLVCWLNQTTFVSVPRNSLIVPNLVWCPFLGRAYDISRHDITLSGHLFRRPFEENCTYMSTKRHEISRCTVNFVFWGFIFRAVTPCELVNGYRRFEEACCLLLQRISIQANRMINHEVGGRRLVRNVSNSLPIDTAEHPRRLEHSTAPLS